jgi:hypothetical protein
MTDRYAIQEYLNLLEALLSGECSAPDFENAYLRMFKSDTTRRPQKVFDVLDGLFADVDAYVADPALREDDDLDEAGLRERVRHARDRLRATID